MNSLDLHLDYGIVEDILKTFLLNEIRKFGFRSVVLGLSGGIDSAVVCELASRALGSDQVLALMMPYRSSSTDSIVHAQLLVEKLGIRAETCSITAAVDAFFEGVPEEDRLRRGNIMARTRMVYLYDVLARQNNRTSAWVWNAFWRYGFSRQSCRRSLQNPDTWSCASSRDSGTVDY